MYDFNNIGIVILFIATIGTHIIAPYIWFYMAYKISTEIWIPEVVDIINRHNTKEKYTNFVWQKLNKQYKINLLKTNVKWIIVNLLFISIAAAIIVLMYALCKPLYFEAWNYFIG